MQHTGGRQPPICEAVHPLPSETGLLAAAPERLGLVLLFVAAGSVTALPLAGPVVHRLGAQRALNRTYFP